jgi:hypothetical protein
MVELRSTKLGSWCFWGKNLVLPEVGGLQEVGCPVVISLSLVQEPFVLLNFGAGLGYNLKSTMLVHFKQINTSKTGFIYMYVGIHTGTLA